MASLRVWILKEKIQLKGDEDEHEQVDSWSNRDLIPLPPSRRTWGWFHYFGYWTLNSLNISNWQTPNTFLGKIFLSVGVTFDWLRLLAHGLSVGQSMMVIVIGKLLITFLSTLIAWCGLRWHIACRIDLPGAFVELYPLVAESPPGFHLVCHPV
jgi:NCS1 family nucleobase:cation symporter-1